MPVTLDATKSNRRGEHGGAAESLADLSTTALARLLLEELGDPDVRTSLHSSAAPTVSATRENGEGLGAGGVSSLVGHRFRILRLYDEGGLGSVYLARDEELNREVAQKQMKQAVIPLQAALADDDHPDAVLPREGQDRADHIRPPERHGHAPEMLRQLQALADGSLRRRIDPREVLGRRLDIDGIPWDIEPIRRPGGLAEQGRRVRAAAGCPG